MEIDKIGRDGFLGLVLWLLSTRSVVVADLLVGFFIVDEIGVVGFFFFFFFFYWWFLQWLFLVVFGCDFWQFFFFFFSWWFLWWLFLVVVVVFGGFGGFFNGFWLLAWQWHGGVYCSCGGGC